MPKYINFKLVPAIVLFVIFAVVGCKKMARVNPKVNIPDTDIYAAGYIVKNGIYHGIYWKNGTAVTLTTVPSNAYSVAVSGNDVFIAGAIQCANNQWVAAYWKNDVVYKLMDSLYSSAATSIAVDKNNVYIAGYKSDSIRNPHAIYWKNGVMTMLSPDSFYSNASAIAINGSDVYIGGDDGTPGIKAVYWKNGMETTLPGDFSYGYGIALSANSVVTCGSTSDYNFALAVAYWSGTTVNTNLYAGSGGSNGYAVALKGNDVYVAGDTSTNYNGKGTACCWKNGQTTNLAIGGVGSRADAIKLSSWGTIFASAALLREAPFITGQPLLGKAVYWKNGVTVQLSGDTSNVSGLAVALHQ